MSVSVLDMVTVITMVGTLVAAFATWKAANAAKKSAEISLKHRENQISPELFISDLLVHLEYDIKSVNHSARGFGEIGHGESIFLEVSNVGKGHAKNIEIKWTIDIEEAIESIKKKGIQSPKIYLDKGQLIIPESGGNCLEEDLKYKVNVLLTDRVDSIRIPYPYLALLSYMHHLENEKKIDFNFSTIGIELIFKDVDNKPYIKNFLITPKVSSIRYGEADGKAMDYKSEVSFQVEEQ